MNVQTIRELELHTIPFKRRRVECRDIETIISYKPKLEEFRGTDKWPHIVSILQRVLDSVRDNCIDEWAERILREFDDYNLKDKGPKPLTPNEPFWEWDIFSY